jgi:hypothetical protein
VLIAFVVLSCLHSNQGDLRIMQYRSSPLFLCLKAENDPFSYFTAINEICSSAG